MPSREEILDHLRKVFEEEFELDPEQVTLDAHLGDDLDIDSLDAIDLIVHIREYTGKKIEPEQFREVRRVSDIVEIINGLVSESTS